MVGGWVNLDDRLSVARVYGPGLTLHQPAGRQVVIANKDRAGGHLHAIEICQGLTTELFAADADTVLFDCGAVVAAGVTAADTRAWFAATPPRPFASAAPEVRGAMVVGADGRTYLVIAHFGAADATEILPALPGRVPRALAGPPADAQGRIVLPPLAIAVIVYE